MLEVVVRVLLALLMVGAAALGVLVVAMLRLNARLDDADERERGIRRS